MILLEQAGKVDLEQTRRVWTRFTTNGYLEREAIRPHIVDAWGRSVSGGCDPHIVKADQLDSPNTRALRDQETTLIRSARPFILALSRAAGQDRHAAMLGDANARVLDVIGDELSVYGPEAVPGPGSLLAEANAGANGIGSAIGHGGYVELVGPEHYIEGFHRFTCQGVPLVGASGEVIGVLSTSVRRLETANRLRDILFCAAQAIECDLLARWLSEAVVHAGPRSELVEKLRQDIIQRFSAARLHLEAAAKRISRGGSASTLVSSAESLIRKFKAVASTWRDLVADARSEPEVVSVPDVVDALRDLLETEARINGIEIYWGRAEALDVVVERKAFARALLERMLNAMQAAGHGGRLRIDVTSSAGNLNGLTITPERGADGTALMNAAQVIPLA